MKKNYLILLLSSFFFSGASAQPLNNHTIDGYRGIWFTLGQETEYGYKYSGGLATYTVKHNPIAIYAPQVDQTFFVYGGTTAPKERHLLCMVGCFDHGSGKVRKPVVVFDKEKVDDPHDNPALSIDSQGYLWVFVSGRGGSRPGHIYRSRKPYDISGFDKMHSWMMCYPQPIHMGEKGFFLFMTRYTGVRKLYFSSSPDGINWIEPVLLADIKGQGETKSGHYQMTGRHGDKLATFFNRHPNGNVDKRTNLYYVQTTDMGRTWTTVDGKKLSVPIAETDSPALVLEVESKNLNLYAKDLNFDAEGNPVVLYLTSGGHQPGPDNGMRQWYVCRWENGQWVHAKVSESTHNYDSGSIWIEGREWTVIAPTGQGAQKWATGGEIVMWKSNDHGKTWKHAADLTSNSPYNHGYVRRPVGARDPFYGFWADGNPERITPSKLYFTDSDGNVFVLPYRMESEWVAPEPYLPR